MSDDAVLGVEGSPDSEVQGDNPATLLLSLMDAEQDIDVAASIDSDVNNVMHDAQSVDCDIDDNVSEAPTHQSNKKKKEKIEGSRTGLTPSDKKGCRKEYVARVSQDTIGARVGARFDKGQRERRHRRKLATACRSPQKQQSLQGKEDFEEP